MTSLGKLLTCFCKRFQIKGNANWIIAPCEKSDCPILQRQIESIIYSSTSSALIIRKPTPLVKCK